MIRTCEDCEMAKASRPESTGGGPALFPVEDERRATLRALNKWRAARGDGRIPDLAGLFGGRRGFANGEFLMKVDPNPAASVLIVCGDDVPLPFGPRSIGNTVRQAVPKALRRVFSEGCAQAAHAGDAVCSDGALRTESGAETLYRSVFMPVTSGDDHVMYAYGALSTTMAAAPAAAAA